MSETIHSAQILVEKALADPKIIEGLQTNTEATLKNLQNDVISQLPPPSRKINDAIWLIVVISFALVMVGAAYVLGAGVTTKLDASTVYAAKSDTILTVFTTVTAFLAGLLIPSPIKK